MKDNNEEMMVEVVPKTMKEVDIDRSAWLSSRKTNESTEGDMSAGDESSDKNMSKQMRPKTIKTSTSKRRHRRSGLNRRESQVSIQSCNFFRF